MKAVIILIAFLLTICIKAEWKPAKKLVGANTHIKHYSTYYEAGKQKSHVAYCVENVSPEGVATQNLRYATIDASNNVVSDIELNYKYGCRVVKIIGDEANKGIAIAVEGQREFHLGVCNATNTKGCFDIYVTISDDSGASWSDPVPVPRHSGKDVADRLAPNFVLNPISHRIYLFYTHRIITSTETYIAYVTRPPGSSIFSTEVITRVQVEERLIGALPTLHNGKVVMNAFIEEKGNTIHMYTENGITWEKNNVLAAPYRFSGFTSDQSTLGPKIIGACTDGELTFVTISEDNGKTWSSVKRLGDKYHKISAGILCKGSFDGLLKYNLMTTSFMQVDQKYLTMTMPGEEPAYINAPFKEVENYGVFMPQLWCFTTPDTKRPAVKAFAYIWAKPNTPMLYVTDNDSI